MRFFRVPLLWVFLGGAVLLGNGQSLATKVRVEPVGEGNFISLSHGQEVMFIDAGSTGYSAAALRARITPQEEKVFEFLDRPPEDTGPRFTFARLQKLEDDLCDSSSVASQEVLGEILRKDRKRAAETELSQRSMRKSAKHTEGAIAGENASSSAGRPSRAALDQVRDSYKDDLLQRVYDGIQPEVLRKTIKTVLVTHPDKDHYGFFPDLFQVKDGSRRQNFFIQDLILSGFYEDYNEDFLKWVEACGRRIGTVTCTGMADGGRGSKKEVLDTWLQEIKDKETEEAALEPPSAHNSEASGSAPHPSKPMFARPFCSALREKTETEKYIETALSFTEASASQIQILSMNAGHSEPPPGRPDLVRIVNEESNANSIVLRVQGQKSAILLTGDAESPTWSHIVSFARQYYTVEDLQTDYVVVSHHGSRTAGATPLPILQVLFNPRCCIFSAGKHAHNHHPHQDTLHDLTQLNTLAYVERHDVSYFAVKQQVHVQEQEPAEESEQGEPAKKRNEKTSHRRKECNKAIFSTLNHGTLEIDLDESKKQMKVSMCPAQTYEAILEEEKGPSQFVEQCIGAFVPEQGSTLQEMVNEFETACHSQDVNVCFWKKAVRHPPHHWEIVKWMPDKNLEFKPFQETHFPITQHVLVNDKKGKFRFLEKRDTFVTAGKGMGEIHSIPTISTSGASIGVFESLLEHGRC